jgi:hypothetical protein
MRAKLLGCVLVDARTHGTRRPRYRHAPTRMLTLRLAFLACAKIPPRGCGRCCFGCSFYAEVQLGQAFRVRPHWPPQQQSISGLVVEDSVAIDVANVRCPADAEYLCFARVSKREAAKPVVDLSSGGFGNGLLLSTRTQLCLSAHPAILHRVAVIFFLTLGRGLLFCFPFLLDFLRGSSVKLGTNQRRLTWPLREDDTHKLRSVIMF